MGSRLWSGNSGRLRFKAAVLAVSLMMAVTLGLCRTPAWARPDVQGGAEVKPVSAFDGFENIEPDSPEQRQLFEALNQRMRQASANYRYDVSGMNDPFYPIKGVLAGHENVCGHVPLNRAGCKNGIQVPVNLVAVTEVGSFSTGLACFEDADGNSFVLRRGDIIGCHYEQCIIEINETGVIVEDRGRRGNMPPRLVEVKFTLPRALQKPNAAQ